MTIRSAQFLPPQACPTSDTVVLTVPTGRLYLVRNLTAVNNSTSATAQLVLSLNGSGAGHRLFRRTIAAGDTLVLDPWWALEPDDELHAVVNPGGCDITVCGYDLEL